MTPEFGVGDPAPDKISALRGAKSFEALRTNGVVVPDVPLGDPGFLAPALLGISRSASPRFRIGLVSHYVERRNSLIADFLAQDGVCDLNVHAAPRDFLGLMAECEFILSSSLHGLIFAESLGLPNLWIRASDEIPGGNFKFDDWFSTTALPQAKVRNVRASDDVFSLAAECELHESTIDVESLLRAFPVEEDWGEPPRTVRRSVTVCRMSPIPVFLISFNRGAMLRRVIAALRKLNTSVDIVVHDNGSDDPVTIEILRQLEIESVNVYRSVRIADADEISLISETVRDYFGDWAEPSRYVVSDCNIDVSIALPNALAVYDELLNLFRRVECVGPMVRIRDIPKRYPLRTHALNRHIEKLWRIRPEIVRTMSGSIAYQLAPIDTTFALHRAGEPFHCLKSGLRVYEPFEVRNLDWYIEDEAVYANSSEFQISNWNNVSETEKYAKPVLDYEEFWAVRQTDDGAIEVYLQALSE